LPIAGVTASRCRVARVDLVVGGDAGQLGVGDRAERAFVQLRGRYGEVFGFTGRLVGQAAHRFGGGVQQRLAKEPGWVEQHLHDVQAGCLDSREVRPKNSLRGGGDRGRGWTASSRLRGFKGVQLASEVALAGGIDGQLTRAASTPADIRVERRARWAWPSAPGPLFGCTRRSGQ
jgi:hypothetical protein